jgi:hypothetical protein
VLLLLQLLLASSVSRTEFIEVRQELTVPVHELDRLARRTPVDQSGFSGVARQ